MVFTIDQVYKEGVPRKQPYHSSELNLNTTTFANLTITPATTPNWAILIDELKIVPDASFSTSGTGAGILKVQFPDYEGASAVTWTLGHLGLRSEKVQEVNSITHYTVKFKPPILVKASNSVNSVTFGLPTDVTISAGQLDFIVRGWQLKESDFD